MFRCEHEAASFQIWVFGFKALMLRSLSSAFDNLEPHKLMVLSFSDVHGRCTEPDGSHREEMRTHMAHFSSSAAARKIQTTEADIIVFAGDATTIPDTVDCQISNFEELEQFVDWFKEVQPHKPKIFIPGNHDTCLDDSTVLESDFKTERRQRLLDVMERNNIHFVGPAGWLIIPLGRGVEFKVLASGFSEGRPPGAKFWADRYQLNGQSEFGTEVVDVDGKNLTMTGVLGAFQYCPATAVTSYVDCAEVYSKVTGSLEEASAALGSEADLVVIHGPPDNLGFKFGPGGGKGPPGPMAEALMKPLIRRAGVMRVGHYHPVADWEGGTRTHLLECNSEACQGSVQMKFVPVKGARPEVCEYPDASDSVHMPDEHTFEHLEVTTIGQVVKGQVPNELTKTLLKKYKWTGPAFNKPEPTEGDGARKYKVVTVPREGTSRQVVIPTIF